MLILQVKTRNWFPVCVVADSIGQPTISALSSPPGDALTGWGPLHWPGQFNPCSDAFRSSGLVLPQQYLGATFTVLPRRGAGATLQVLQLMRGRDSSPAFMTSGPALSPSWGFDQGGISSTHATSLDMCNGDSSPVLTDSIRAGTASPRPMRLLYCVACFPECCRTGVMSLAHPLHPPHLWSAKVREGITPSDTKPQDPHNRGQQQDIQGELKHQ